jgi:hypothetical protein
LIPISLLFWQSAFWKEMGQGTEIAKGKGKILGHQWATKTFGKTA